jgi:hypothetical protein
MPENKSAIGARIPESLYWRFRQAAALKKLEIGKALEISIAAYCDRAPLKSPLKNDHPTKSIKDQNEPLKKIGGKITEALYWRLRAAAPANRQVLSEAIETAIRDFCNSILKNDGGPKKQSGGGKI